MPDKKKGRSEPVIYLFSAERTPIEQKNTRDSGFDSCRDGCSAFFLFLSLNNVTLNRSLKEEQRKLISLFKKRMPSSAARGRTGFMEQNKKKNFLESIATTPYLSLAASNFIC